MHHLFKNATKQFALKQFAQCICLACLFCTTTLAQSNDDPLAEKIAKLQSELNELSPSQAVDADDQSIRKLVKKAFEIEMRIQQLRITKAESDLQKIKQHFASRMKASEEIISDRIAELGKPKDATPKDFTPPEQDDASAKVLATEGWQLWRKRDLRSALVKFEASVAKDPTDAHALNGLGWSYLQTGQYDLAVDAFQRGRKIEANNGGILNGLGQAFQALGRKDEARDLLVESVEGINKSMGEAIAVKRGLTAPWIVLVRLNIETKKYDEAIEWAKRYLKHKPDDKTMRDLLEQAQAGKAE